MQLSTLIIKYVALIKQYKTSLSLFNNELTESKQNHTSFVMAKILLISSPILILDISVWKDIPFLPSFFKKTGLFCGV